MKINNYGYIVPFGIAFIISTGSLLFLIKLNNFLIILILVELLILFLVSFFSFKKTTISNENIIIHFPIRGVKKVIDHKNVSCFLFTYKHDSKSGIDLHLEINSNVKLNKRTTIKYFVKKKDILLITEFLKKNNYKVKFKGDFELL